MAKREFEGRTALVTGGSRGIGRAVCRLLADGGARVAINYQQNEAAAAETLALVEGTADKAIIVGANVSQADDVARMVEVVRERLGPIDMLVNNAGIAGTIAHEQLTFQDWKRMFATNVDGPFLTTWAVKDEMIARRFGRIVNVSSIAGIQLNKRMIHYAATKAAVINFTRNCAHAFAPFNVRVNCVAPGLTNTDLARSANPGLVEELISITPMGRMAEPEEIASAVKFLLSDESSLITGQTIVACGGRV
jgi:3-oxoacyl-[acyl-carrier protein] reductase